MLASPPNPTRPVIIQTICDVFAGPAWHGPSLRASLRGLSSRDAARRIAPGRNTIWELVLHLAYTRHRLVMRLGADVARFPRKLGKPWWPTAPGKPTDAAWRDGLALLTDYQDRLIAAIDAAPEARLRRQRPGQPRTIAHELLGVAVHDGYHAGQIRLLRVLIAGRAPRAE